MTRNDTPETVVVLNPASGSGDHADAVSERAEQEGYAVERTKGPGDAARFARAAAERGASTVVAAGGDGTVNEVARGIDRADAFDRVTLGVIPAGTGNNFAGNVGITGIEHAFTVLAEGERRRLDLGRANGDLFVNSCVAGLTAESSDDTSSELKRRLGVLAYVVTTLREYAEFDPPRLQVAVHGDAVERNSTSPDSQARQDADAPEDSEAQSASDSEERSSSGNRTQSGDAEETVAWKGTPVVVFAGNARRIAPTGDSQADAEDGLLDVTIVEEASALDLMGDAVTDRLLGGEAEHLTHMLAPALEVTVEDPGTTQFSLDGEMVTERTVALSTQANTLEVAVGEGYTPDLERR